MSTVTSLPATVAAAISRNVADDRSPGTTIRPAFRRPFQPSGSTISAPVASSATIGAPRNRNMRSVWSRERAGSRSSLRPRACRPASTSALLSWALATGSS